MHSLSSNHSSDMMLTCLKTIPTNLPIEEKKSVFPANAVGSDSDLKKNLEKMVLNYQASGSEEDEEKNDEVSEGIENEDEEQEEGIGNSLKQNEIRNVWVQHYNVEIVIVLCLTKDLKDYPKLLFKTLQFITSKRHQFS